ncbi:MAG: cell division protein ZapE, partial [Methyloligellaceae bacterium]
MDNGPLQRYRAMTDSGELALDMAQLLAAEKLQLLANRLSQYEPPARTDFFSFFTRKRGEVPEGLYMFGGVGRGKTMLMDLFFETVPFEPKRRVHFHEFMAEIHELIAKFRKLQDGDPIPLVADTIATEARLLCFDELHVTDIADAMILGRLFQGLFEAHCVMVATSNAAPQELYKDGLNRPLFEPFIELVGDRMEVLQLEAVKDYRLEKLQGTELYFTPADEAARSALST